MPSDLKTLILHGHSAGPNPWKVALMLEELDVPYETKFWEFPNLKTPDFEKLNPNGRTPALEDPNTGITLWESGAIVEYLVETYDKSNTFTYTSSPDKYYLKQWLHFQVSGQGPYFGQRVWFNVYHEEKIQSAIDRYGGEVKRVLTVIDSHLKSTGSQYLVGDKYTYADLSFVPWNFLLPMPIAMGESFEKELEKDLPTYWQWWQRILNRPATQKIKKAREAAMAKGH